MNVFLKEKIAQEYDAYYQSAFGKKVDVIEKKMFSELLEQISATSLLELGCGTGHWTAFFADQGFNVTGLDNSEAMLSLARSKGIDAEFILADSEALPFEAESQQVVASVTMLEFVDTPDKVATEIHRILKPRGWLLLGSLNENSVLGQTKGNDEVFKHANMLTSHQIKQAFHRLKFISQKSGVYLSPEFEILDGINHTQDVEPVFFATLFQKG